VTEGEEEGRLEGCTEGKLEGIAEGLSDGKVDGTSDGESDGMLEGTSDGESDGMLEGTSDGESDGMLEGTSDGESDGMLEGTSEGDKDGERLGTPDGPAEGPNDGALEVEGAALETPFTFQVTGTSSSSHVVGSMTKRSSPSHSSTQPKKVPSTSTESSKTGSSDLHWLLPLVEPPRPPREGVPPVADGALLEFILPPPRPRSSRIRKGSSARTSRKASWRKHRTANPVKRILRGLVEVFRACVFACARRWSACVKASTNAACRV
jgi:hypothetical protein